MTPASDTTLYSMMGTTDETVSSGLYRIAVLLPLLWPDRSAVWLAQAEAQFQLASITLQRTKFNYVVSLLNQQQAPEVEDFISSPPEQEPFDRIRQRYCAGCPLQANRA